MKADFHTDSERFLRAILEQLETDVLFECFAGLLRRSGNDAVRQIHVVPKENYNRNFRHDIVPATTEGERFFEREWREVLIMYTSRSSILDYLPEDFFVEPDNTDEFWDESGREKTPEKMEAYRKKVREQLESARRFFRPLEVEYNKLRIERELREIDQLENYDQLLADFWVDFPLPDERWRRFVRTLHLTPYVLGDREKTKALIEYVLQAPVSLNFEIEEFYEPEPAEQWELMGEEKVLGFNMVIGSAVYDYLEVCQLKISDLSTEEFFDLYDEESDSGKLLQAIIDHYFPLSIEVRPDFVINSRKGHTGETAPMMVVGFSSVLENTNQ